MARAVEPEAGEKKDGHEDKCLNCGTALVGDFCHACGQHGHVHRTLSAFWHDLAHGVLHFEGKTWHTLPLLAWRPGELTRRYIEGERARFVSPMALFLFSVFLMFAAFSWTGGPFGSGKSQTAENFQESIATSVKRADDAVSKLEKERAEAARNKDNTAALDKRLADARDEASMLHLMQQRGVTEAGLSRVSDDIPSELGWLGHIVEKARANPALLLYKLQNSAYKYSWALIPLSLPFLWLLFPFSRRFRMYDHTVFVTYSLCFMTLLVVVLSVIRMLGVGNGPIAVALMIVPPIHMYRQLRGAYRLTRFGAFWRAVLLVNFAFLAAGLFGTLLLALGAFG